MIKVLKEKKEIQKEQTNDLKKSLVKDLNSIKHNFNTINQADLQKKLKGYISLINSDKNLSIFAGTNIGVKSILANSEDSEKLMNN